MIDNILLLSNLIRQNNARTVITIRKLGKFFFSVSSKIKTNYGNGVYG